MLKLIPKHETDKRYPLNYRPISLLEIRGKICEKNINARLKRHIENRNILPSTQHGFRTKRGTQRAITLTHETIAQLTSRRKQCYIVLSDVSRAFDKVRHNGLKYKLLNLNLPTFLEKILWHYSDNREAKISLNNTGTPFNFSSGMTQGRVSSPTLSCSQQTCPDQRSTA